MYKVFGRRLGWVVLGSVGTIIGLVFGNVLPLRAVSGEDGRFDRISCKEIVLLKDSGVGVAGVIGINPANQSGYIHLVSEDGSRVVISSGEELDNNRSGLIAITSASRMASFHIDKHGEGKIITTDIEDNTP